MQAKRNLRLESSRLLVMSSSKGWIGSVLTRASIVYRLVEEAGMSFEEAMEKAHKMTAYKIEKRSYYLNDIVSRASRGKWLMPFQVAGLAEKFFDKYGYHHAIERGIPIEGYRYGFLNGRPLFCDISRPRFSLAEKIKQIEKKYQKGKTEVPELLLFELFTKANLGLARMPSKRAMERSEEARLDTSPIDLCY